MKAKSPAVKRTATTNAAIWARLIATPPKRTTTA